MWAFINLRFSSARNLFGDSSIRLLWRRSEGDAGKGSYRGGQKEVYVQLKEMASPWKLIGMECRCICLLIVGGKRVRFDVGGLVGLGGSPGWRGGSDVDVWGDIH